MPRQRIFSILPALLVAALPASAPAAPLSEQMRAGFPGAVPVADYSAAQIAQALQKLLALEATPSVGEPKSVSPTSP